MKQRAEKFDWRRKSIVCSGKLRGLQKVKFHCREAACRIHVENEVRKGSCTHSAWGRRARPVYWPVKFSAISEGPGSRWARAPRVRPPAASRRQPLFPQLCHSCARRATVFEQSWSLRTPTTGRTLSTREETSPRACPLPSPARYRGPPGVESAPREKRKKRTARRSRLLRISSN